MEHGKAHDDMWALDTKTYKVRGQTGQQGKATGTEAGRQVGRGLVTGQPALTVCVCGRALSKPYLSPCKALSKPYQSPCKSLIKAFAKPLQSLRQA